MIMTTTMMHDDDSDNGNSSGVDHSSEDGHVSQVCVCLGVRGAPVRSPRADASMSSSSEASSTMPSVAVSASTALRHASGAAGRQAPCMGHLELIVSRPGACGPQPRLAPYLDSCLAVPPGQTAMQNPPGQEPGVG